MQDFLVSLGKQAQSLAQMSPSDRQNYELKRDLDETKQSLTEKERLAKVNERKFALVESGVSEEDIFSIGQAILSNPELKKTIGSEDDLFDRIEDVAEERNRQQAVISALHKIDPKIPKNDPLVFELSSTLEKNPDFDEKDLEEIAEGILKGVKRSNVSRVLSKRQRSNAVKGYMRSLESQPKDYSKMSPKEALKAQIFEKRKQQQSKR